MWHVVDSTWCVINMWWVNVGLNVVWVSLFVCDKFNVGKYFLWEQCGVGKSVFMGPMWCW